MIQSQLAEIYDRGEFVRESNFLNEKFLISEEELFCWHCYEKYCEMYQVLNRNPSNIHAHAIRSAHCMRDRFDITT
ncbi:hypothetical protein KIN20_019153 [Parelaphostrongylus tenuis]|uniref:Uncharacterized protein n=1 Tax=Parelaphostrongylus tenuis TaxID=148309 RepID=A0AAD5MKM5_PARTN|nr:hypothetical protein KIN20_019153 [Parelaphostrongylus tenuis]